MEREREKEREEGYLTWIATAIYSFVRARSWPYLQQLVKNLLLGP